MKSSNPFLLAFLLSLPLLFLPGCGLGGDGSSLKLGDPKKPEENQTSSAERAFEENRVGAPATAAPEMDADASAQAALVKPATPNPAIPAPAEDAEETLPPPPDPRPRGTQTESGVFMYSNDDLAGLSGGSAHGEEELARDAASAQDETTALGEQYLAGVAQASVDRQAAEIENARAASDRQTLQKELDDMARREASLRNPLVRRAPETAAEQGAGNGADANARLAAIEKRRAEINTQMQKEKSQP